MPTTPPPTATRITPTLIPTVPPLTRVSAAESVHATTIAQLAPTLTVLATGTPPPLDSFQLIDLAWLRGEIDIDHAAVFKIFALFGVRRAIPAPYISQVAPRGDGTGLFLYALKDWDALSPATQNTIADFITPKEITPIKTPATPIIRLPIGIYTTTIHPGDNLTSELSLIGRWEFDTTSGAVTLNGKRVITRSYSQTSDRIIFVDQYGSYACDQVRQEGIYQLGFQERVVTFTKISDSCDSRSQVLTAHPWIRQ